MTSSQFKVQRERGAGLKPSRTREALDKSTLADLEAIWAGLREGRSPEWRPNQYTQKAVYAQHCAALRKKNVRKAKTPRDPIPFACLVTKRRELRAERRAAQLQLQRRFR